MIVAVVGCGKTPPAPLPETPAGKDLPTIQPRCGGDLVLLVVGTRLGDPDERVVRRVGDPFEQRLQAVCVRWPQLRSDQFLNLCDHGISAAQDLTASISEVELLNMAMAWMLSALQLAPALKPIHQGGHRLRSDVQAAGHLRAGQPRVCVDRHQQRVVRHRHAERP